MAHEMRLDLKVTGIARYHRAAEAIERLARAQRMLGASGGNLPVPAGSGGNGGGSGGGGSRPNAPPRPKGGPHSSLQQAVQNLHLAQQSGNPTAIADAQYHLQLAQKRVARLSPQSFGQRFNRWAASSRFGGAGGGIQPLVGQTMNLMGLAKLSGPAMLVTAALIGLAKATFTAQRNLDQFGKDSALGGGTFGQTKAAKMLGGATGVDIFGLSRRMQQSYYNGGMESIHLRRYGYSSGYGMARETNSIAPALRALKAMVESGDLRALQDIGAEGLYGLKNLKKSEIDKYFDRISTSISPEKVAAAMRFNLEMEELKQSLTELGYSLTPLINMASKLAQFWANIFNGNGLDGKPINYLAPAGSGAKASPAERNAEAQDRNTRAIQELNDSVVEMTQAYKGGGRRGREAIPEYFHRMNLEQREQAALGAFI